MVHYNSIIHYDVELELVMGDRPCTGSLAAAYRGGYGGVSRRRGLARLVSASYLALVRDNSCGIECFGVSVCCVGSTASAKDGSETRCRRVVVVRGEAIALVSARLGYQMRRVLAHQRASQCHLILQYRREIRGSGRCDSIKHGDRTYVSNIRKTTFG